MVAVSVGRAGKIAALAAVLAACGAGTTARGAISVALTGTTTVDQSVSGTYTHTLGGDPVPLSGGADVVADHPATLGYSYSVLKQAIPTDGTEADSMGDFQSHADFDTTVADGGVMAGVTLSQYADSTMMSNTAVDALVWAHVTYGIAVTFDELYPMHLARSLQMLTLPSVPDGLDATGSELAAAATIRVRIWDGVMNVVDVTYDSATDPTDDAFNWLVQPGSTVYVDFDVTASAHSVANAGTVTELTGLGLGLDAFAFPSVTITPEPGTLGLMGIGLMVLGRQKRRAR